MTMRKNKSINDSVIKYKGSEEKCLFWIFFYENRYLMTNLWLHDKIVCNNKSVRSITWGNAEKIPVYYMNIEFKRGCDHMNDLFIQGVHIDWNRISRNSYLWQIDAIKGLEELTFYNPVTFLSEKTEAGNQLYWKHAQLPVDLIQKAVRRIMLFLLMIPIRNCMKLFVLPGNIVKQSGGIF